MATRAVHRVGHSSFMKGFAEALGHALPDRRQQSIECAIGNSSGRRDPLDLGRLLHRAIALDPAVDRDQFHARC